VLGLVGVFPFTVSVVAFCVGFPLIFLGHWFRNPSRRARTAIAVGITVVVGGFLVYVLGPYRLEVLVSISPSAYAPGALVYGTDWKPSYHELTISINNPSLLHYQDFEGHIQVNGIRPIVFKKISNIIGFDMAIDEPPKMPAVFRNGWQVTIGSMTQFSPMYSFKLDRFRKGPPIQFVVIFDEMKPDDVAAVNRQCEEIKHRPETPQGICDSQFSVMGFLEFTGILGRDVTVDVGRIYEGHGLMHDPIVVVPPSRVKQ
jgi:hypothetical protein